MSGGLRSRHTTTATTRGAVPLRPVAQPPHRFGEPLPVEPRPHHPDAPPFDPQAWPGDSLRARALAYARAVAPRIGQAHPGPLADAALYSTILATTAPNPNAGLPGLIATRTHG